MRVFVLAPNSGTFQEAKKPLTLLPMQERSIWLLETYEARAHRTMLVFTTVIPALGLMALGWWWNGMPLLALLVCAVAAVTASLLSRFESRARAELLVTLRNLLDLYGYDDVAVLDVSLAGGRGSPFVIVPA